MAGVEQRAANVRMLVVVSMLAAVWGQSPVTEAAAAASDEACNQTVRVMENLTKQQVEQMAAAPASARAVHDCYTKFASSAGSGEACLKRECVAVVEEGIPDRQGKTKEVSVEDCLSAAEDLVVINKTIELNYLNFMRVCRHSQAAE